MDPAQAVPVEGGVPNPNCIPANLYPVPEKLFQDIENRFTYHPPAGDQAARYERIRYGARQLAMLIAGITPQSREQALALTHLQQAAQWANAAIACNE